MRADPAGVTRKLFLVNFRADVKDFPTKFSEEKETYITARSFLLANIIASSYSVTGAHFPQVNNVPCLTFDLRTKSTLQGLPPNPHDYILIMAL